MQELREAALILQTNGGPDIRHLRALDELVRELHAQLDYCGWGDSWERETSADLRKKVEDYVRSGVGHVERDN